MSANTRNRFILGTLVAFALVLATVATPAYAEVRDEFHKSYPLSADGRVSLANINGSVTVLAWDKNEVQLDAIKTGESKERVDEARIEVVAGSTAIDIRTKYPESNHYRNGATVEYTLHVPRKARLDKIEAVNGRVSIDGVQGEIRASSVNGEVSVKNSSASLTLNTVNGRVAAELANLGNSVKMETVNGAVELRLPSNAAAEINANTVHGGISNEFNIPVNKGRWMPSSELRARLGEGTSRIKLSTVNGGIEIQRLSDGKPLSKVTNLLPEDKSHYY